MSILSFLGYVAAIAGINFVCIGVVAGALWMSQGPQKEARSIRKNVSGNGVSYTNA